MHPIHRSTISGLVARLTALIVMTLAFGLRLHAAAGGNLPWERPMTTIATSLTGPVAYAIGLIGIAIAGGAMLWGGELTEFGRRAWHDRPGGLILVFAAPMLAQRFWRQRGCRVALCRNRTGHARRSFINPRIGPTRFSAAIANLCSSPSSPR